MIYIDIETFSGTDLKSAGVYRYVEDPAFEIMMAGWSVDFGRTVRVATGWDAIAAIPGLFDPSVQKVAHNAAFERICFSRFLGLPSGEYLDPEPWTDTMALAGVWGLPQGLDALAVELGAERKDSAGTALINFFCRPNRSGQRNRPEDHPERWLEFLQYCQQDVVTLADVHARLRMLGWPGEELRTYLTDQKINDRGFAVDLELATRAHAAAAENRLLHQDEVRILTGVENPGSQPQMMAWAKESGLALENLRSETVEEALTDPELPPVARRVLELRQELAGTAVAKYQTALDSACADGRIRGSFRYFGAHTGRWSGRGMQPQNLPREALPSEEATLAAILDLSLGNGADATTLKALVRAMLVGPFTVVDYAAIEARVIAWLAGEQWAIDAFRAGRDIYVETAERMGGLTRSQGKVAVLALGYAGGTGSLQAMGAQGTELELKFLVAQWRRANRKICQLWGDVESAFADGGRCGPKLEITADGADRYMQLPSGRAIVYRNVKWERYFDKKTGKRKEGFRFDDVRGYRMGTYGGRLTENATQAVARDLLAAALVRLEEKGFRAVAHVHDEIIVEGDHPVEEVKKIMVASPSWADGLPVDGEGFVCQRYRKG